MNQTFSHLLGYLKCTSMNIIIIIEKYTLLQKKAYTLFPGEYSKCRWRRNPYKLEKLPIRVVQQLSLGLWQNSKWFQSSKEKFIGKLRQKVHKNLFLPLTSMLLADKVHAFKLCFTTLEPLWIFLANSVLFGLELQWSVISVMGLAWPRFWVPTHWNSKCIYTFFWSWVYHSYLK